MATTILDEPEAATVKGPRCAYRPKEPPPVSVSLTALGKAILRGAATRTGYSQSDVVESLLRLHGGRLEAIST